MLSSSFTRFNHPAYQPVKFGSMARTSISPDPLTGQTRHYDHSTWLERDMDVVLSFPTVLKTLFPDGVDVQFHGVSDGTEAYFILRVLQQALGEKAAEKYPFKAFDLSKERIDVAQKGVFGLAKFDINVLKAILESSFRDFLEPLQDIKIDAIPDAGQYDILDAPNPDGIETNREMTLSHFIPMQVKPVVHRQIQFEQADIRLAAKQPFEKPTVIVCKNTLFYFTPSELRQVCQDLFRNLPSRSMVVIGEYDRNQMVALNLEMAGFRTLPRPEALNGLYWQKP